MQNLDDLVSQAESIATNLEDDEIPHIHRNIEQLRKRGETYYNRAAQNDLKAAKLLGSKAGYELSVGLSKTLESLNVISSTDGLLSINIEDIPSFLKNERETAILSAINLTRTNTQNMSYKLCEQSKSAWWADEKRNIMNALVNSDKLPVVMSLSSSGPLGVKSWPETYGGSFTKISLSREEQLYAHELANYIDERLLKGQSGFRTSNSLLKCTCANKSTNPELAEIGRLIIRFCNIQTSPKRQGRDEDSLLSYALVTASLAHLENEFWAYITSSITAYSGDSKRQIAAYVTMELAPRFEVGALEDQSVMGGVPVWPMIFACLRAGRFSDAVSVAKDAASNLGDFYVLLEAWSEKGALHPDQSRKLATEYQRHVRNSRDECKRLVYSLLAGCDTEEIHGPAIGDIDDFLWLRLSQVRRAASIGSHQQSLCHLQRSITEQYGEQYFKASQQPFLYCRMLFLCQLFEQGLAFLTRFEQLRCHAIHLSLVLWQHEILHVSTTLEAPLLNRCEDDHQGLSRLNLIRLVALYTRKFEASHPKEALDLYFILSELPCDLGEQNGFVTCASSLAMESGQLELLFGRINRDGNSCSGLLARYGPVADSVLEVVANRLKRSGRLEEACEALQMSGRFEEAATELAELVANTISLPSNHPTLSRLQIKTHALLSCISDCPEAALLECTATIVRFISSSADGDVEAALAALDRTKLLPVSQDQGAVRSAMETFRTLPELVRSLFPNLLVSAMRTLRGAARLRQSSQDSLVDIRQRAEALIIFTGQLPYRMPSEVYASLSQLEMEIK